jgi:hypothetical protein
MMPRSAQRRRLLKAVSLSLLFAGASLVTAACGNGAVSPGVASVGTTTTTVANHHGGSNAPNGDTELAYAVCMRSHGVPNFPDPSSTGGFEFGRSVNTSSSSFEAAQTKCQSLIGGGLPAPGTTLHPSAATLALLLKAARCMRAHGVTDFPDPSTTMPSTHGFQGVISVRDGAILVFPGSLDMQSPAFTQAAAACHFPLTNH